MESAHQLISTFKKFKRHAESMLGSMLWRVPLVMALFYFTRVKKNFGAFPAAVLSAFGAFFGKDLWQHIVGFFHDGGVVVQSGFIDGSGKLLATVIAFSAFRGRISASVVNDFARRIGSFGRVADGWSAFVSWIVGAVEKVINQCRSMFGKPRITLLRSAHAPMLEWARDVDELYNKVHSSGVQADSAMIDSIVQLVVRGSAFKNVYRGTRMAKDVEDVMVKAYNLLQPYIGSLNARNNFRKEPEFALLYGAPGIGKTLLTIPICLAVMQLSGIVPKDATAQELIANVWQKGNSEYWNGYSSQKCVIQDDAFQARPDATDKDNEYMNVIKQISSWAMPLNFADLASKGLVYFVSDFVLGTTNMSSLTSAATMVLHEPEAVMRRIGHGYELQLNKEYANECGRLDIEKFNKAKLDCAQRVGIDSFPWHLWKAYKHDFHSGRSEPLEVSLRDVVVKIADNLRVKEQQHGSALSYYDDLAMRFAATPAEDDAGIVTQAGRFAWPTQATQVCLSTLKEKLTSFEREIEQHASWFHKAFKTTLFTLGGVFAVKLMVEALRSVCGFVWAGIAAMLGIGDDKEKKKHGVPRAQSNRLVTKPVRNGIQVQSGDDSIVNNVYNNTYKLHLRTVTGDAIVLGQVTFLDNQLAVQPEHFTASVHKYISEGRITGASTLCLTSAVNSQHKVEYTVTQYLALRRDTQADNDVEFLIFDSMRAHRRITSNFMTESNLPSVFGRGRIDICEIDNNRTLTNTTHRTTQLVPTLMRGSGLRFGGRLLNRYFTYSSNTSVGDCGAPVSLVDHNSFAGRCVFGFHVAGDTARRSGFCSIVTQEMIAAASRSLLSITDDFAEDMQKRGVELQAGEVLPFSDGGSFLPIWEVNRKAVICPKSAYYKTELYGAYGEYKCLPAHMKEVYVDGELVYPMQNAVRPYSSPVLIYDRNELKNALYTAMRPLISLTVDSPRRIYSFEEAVLGVPEEKFRSIPRGTAAGYPYCLDVTGGKKQFFGDGEVYQLDTPLAIELKKRVSYVLEAAQDGRRCAHVFVDFLKDELRSEKKVAAVATRLISAAPLDYVIAWRMYFGAFSAAVMRTHTGSGLAPGICTFTDWSFLANKLSSKGDRVFAGDFKGFDSSEQPCGLDVILDFVNAWYDDGPENALVRRVLWADLVHSRHIGGLGRDQKYIYQWNKSLPSGHPFTTIVNSMYALMLMVSCYRHLTGDLVGFWTHCFTIVYGDDNVTNVDEHTSGVFNQVTVAQAMFDLYGLVYTSDNKDGELCAISTLDGVTFLKRRFFLDRGHWLCPLEIDSFLYTPYWCKNKRMEALIRIDVLENALEELSLHEEKAWLDHGKKIYEVLQVYKAAPNAPCDRQAYQEIVLSRSDNWY